MISSDEWCPLIGFALRGFERSAIACAHCFLCAQSQIVCGAVGAAHAIGYGLKDKE